MAEIAGGRPLARYQYDVLSAAASRAEGKEVKVQPAFPAPSSAPAAQAAAPAPALPSRGPARRAGRSTPSLPPPAPAGALKPGEELVKHSRMRAAIGKNTAASAFTAPHVTTMWDVDVSAVLAHRAAHKKEFAAAGVNLTLTAYFIEAVVAGLRKVPAANSSYSDEAHHQALL